MTRRRSATHRSLSSSSPFFSLWFSLFAPSATFETTPFLFTSDIRRHSVPPLQLLPYIQSLYTHHSHRFRTSGSDVHIDWDQATASRKVHDEFSRRSREYLHFITFSGKFHQTPRSASTQRYHIDVRYTINIVGERKLILRLTHEEGKKAARATKSVPESK